MDLSAGVLPQGISHPEVSRFIITLSYIVAVTITTILAG